MVVSDNRKPVTPALAAMRVNRLVKVLNKKVPDWATRVKLKQLNMQDLDRCVMGQVFGPALCAVTDGVAVLGLDALNDTQQNTWVRYGIDLFTTWDSKQDRTNWALLTDAWKTAIRERREQLKQKKKV